MEEYLKDVEYINPDKNDKYTFLRFVFIGEKINGRGTPYVICCSYGKKENLIIHNNNNMPYCSCNSQKCSNVISIAKLYSNLHHYVEDILSDLIDNIIDDLYGKLNMSMSNEISTLFESFDKIEQLIEQCKHHSDEFTKYLDKYIIEIKRLYNILLKINDNHSSERNLIKRILFTLTKISKRLGFMSLKKNIRHTLINHYGLSNILVNLTQKKNLMK